MKRTRREFARGKTSNSTNTITPSKKAKPVMSSHVNGVTPSHAAKNQSPSLLEQATGALSWQEVKDLINMSRGIGTPGRALQDFARKIVGHTDIDTVDEKQLIEAFGTTDRYFVRGLLGQALKAGSIGGDSRSGIGGDGYDFIVAVQRGAKPKDQIAAMLVLQMAATHMAIINYINRLARTEYIDQHDCHERTLNKLLRVFIMQVEAFNRYQNGGEQKVTVQNVSVSEYAQAIVGDVTQSPFVQPAETPALTHSRQAAMPQMGGLEGDLETEKRAWIEYAARTKSSS